MNDSANPHSLNRRQFIATTALGTAGVLVAGNALTAGAASPSTITAKARKRYAVVGVGSRSNMYRDAILKSYPEHAELVGFCDNNIGRLRLAQARSSRAGGREIPVYDAKDFDRMIRETKPEVVIVTTKDSTHGQYIIRAMELGCDVITEKPMTTDEKKCRAILNAQRKTGRNCRVAFNYRYSPPRTQVKDLLMSGVIGDVLSVDFHWLLDTSHGADYFRRWHANKANSGGLMVHKSTHHFDLVNWWLSAVPVSVMATGKRDFYTPQMAKRLGLQGAHERCLTCPEKDKCTFYLDLAENRGLKELYLDNEKYDGYFRDRCVWRPDIDIEDTMNVQVLYNTGATLSYSLNAFNAWEGYMIAFNGTKGRIEHKVEEKISINGDGSVPGAIKGEGTYIRIFPMRAPAYRVSIWTGEGAHGGGDQVMLDDLFLPEKSADKYLRASDQRGGAYSILTGIAANHSIKTGEAVEIAKLVPGLKLPDYPAMPSHTMPVPMPPKA
ncbi:MAG: Gfo/Idh/MocA family oxidoreductase [Akkermansiaceae bacterium]|nr:Gfo/Idh/MocA family oxidoreductase [Verrucomicrobiales bacterium]